MGQFRLTNPRSSASETPERLEISRQGGRRFISFALQETRDVGADVTHVFQLAFPYRETAPAQPPCGPSHRSRSGFRSCFIFLQVTASAHPTPHSGRAYLYASWEILSWWFRDSLRAGCCWSKAGAGQFPPFRLISQVDGYRMIRHRGDDARIKTEIGWRCSNRAASAIRRALPPPGRACPPRLLPAHY